jgi:hypothetical protein
MKIRGREILDVGMEMRTNTHSPNSDNMCKAYSWGVVDGGTSIRANSQGKILLGPGRGYVNEN